MDPLGVWAASLRGVSQDMINHGFKKLVSKRLEWPPSAPEFAGLCQLTADDFDFPSLDEAEKNISKFRRDKSVSLSPFEYTLYRRINDRAYELYRMDAKSFRKALRRYYQEVEKCAVNGGDLLEQPVLVEEKRKDPSPASKDFAKDQIQKIKCQLGVVING